MIGILPVVGWQLSRIGYQCTLQSSMCCIVSRSICAVWYMGRLNIYPNRCYPPSQKAQPKLHCPMITFPMIESDFSFSDLILVASPFSGVYQLVKNRSGYLANGRGLWPAFWNAAGLFELELQQHKEQGLVATRIRGEALDREVRLSLGYGN